MLIRYMPDDGDPQRWEFDPDRVRASEAALMQRHWQNKPWDQFKAAIQQGDVTARRVLLWHLLRRQHHTLRIEDVPDFYTGELLIEFGRTELLTMRGTVERTRAIADEAERAQMLAAIDDEIAALGGADIDGVDVGEGKAS